MWLSELASSLSKAKIPYAVVGGFAVALHGAVRGTLDIDLVIAHEERFFVRAEEVLRSLGLVPRLPVTSLEVFNFREEYIRNRNLIAWSFFHPDDGIKVVDIIITHDLRKMKTKTVSVDGTAVVILSVSDLIAMKRESGREQDKSDIAALEKLL